MLNTNFTDNNGCSAENTANIFDFINQEAAHKEKIELKKEAPLQEYVLAAVQIIRIVKKNERGTIVHKREVIDSCSVTPVMPADRCKKRMEGKAKMIGNCFTIEHYEKIGKEF